MPTIDPSIRRRYRAQKSMRTTIEQVWDQIDYYTGPVKDTGAIATNPQGGTGQNIEQRKDLWDFTAIDGRDKLSASIQGNVTNPKVRWGAYAAQSAEMNRDTEVRTWLDERSEEVWNDIQDSDFNVEIGCNFHELTGPGHTFLGCEPIDMEIGEVDTKEGKKDLKEMWQGVDFTAFPLRECYFEQGRKGKIKTFWRRHTWQASQVMDFCEDKEIPIPVDVQTAYDKGETAKLFEVVLCVFERPEILKKKKRQYPAVAKRRPFGFYYWREDTGELLGEEGGYYERPVFMGRWSKTAGSKWGHGPSNLALPTVKFVNAWKELLRIAGEKSIDPSLLTTKRNILSTPDLRPGGVTMVADLENLKALKNESNFNVGEVMLESDQKMIRSIYHVDELQLKDSPAMTATEAQIRYEWMLKLLGKTATFIEEDLLAPAFMTILEMRIRMGASPPMPEKLRKAGGLINVVFQGPLARSQRTDEVAAIERGATFVAGLAQFYPPIRAAFDPVEAVKAVFQRLGMPAGILPPDNILRQKMKEIEDQMNQAQAADTAQKTADAHDKMASARAKAGMGPVAGATYPALPPQPNLTPAGRPIGRVM